MLKIIAFFEIKIKAVRPVISEGTRMWKALA